MNKFNENELSKYAFYEIQSYKESSSLFFMVLQLKGPFYIYNVGI
jgi:hypothetical protein